MVDNNSWVLCDLDDTLIAFERDGKRTGVSEAYSDIAKKFVKRLRREGIPYCWSRNLLEVLDTNKATLYGFGEEERYADSFVDTYLMLSKEPDEEVVKDIFYLGMEIIHEYQAVPVNGAGNFLEVLADQYNIAIVTKGNRRVQYNKMVQAGLLEFVDAYFVVNKKDQETWDNIFDAIELDKEEKKQSWVIGDSVRDVNPALSSGLNAILVSCAHVWKFDKGQIGSPKEGCVFHNADNLTDAIALIQGEI